MFQLWLSLQWSDAGAWQYQAELCGVTPIATTLQETVLPKLPPFVSSNALELQREVWHWVMGPPFGRWEHLQLGAILCHKLASFWQLLHLTYYFNFYHKFLHKWTSTCLCIFYITYICGCVAMRHGVLILQDRSSDSIQSFTATWNS